MARITILNITSALRGCNSTLVSLDTSQQVTDVDEPRIRLIQTCLRIIERRVLPDLRFISETEDGISVVLSLVLHALLEILSLGKSLENVQGQHSNDGRALAQRAAQLIGKLFKTDEKPKLWKAAFGMALDEMVISCYNCFSY